MIQLSEHDYDYYGAEYSNCSGDDGDAAPALNSAPDDVDAEASGIVIVQLAPWLPKSRWRKGC